jgi:polysaccharide deacetylase 2 family uncharacterized protein YibQ
MRPRRRNRSRRRTGISPQGALTGLILLLIIAFFTLDFLSKGKMEVKQEVKIAKKVEKVEKIERVTKVEEKKAGRESLPAKIEEEKAKAVIKEEQPVVLPPRVAIIIDDLGYSLRAARPIFAIKYPLTLSILPGLRYSIPLTKKFSRAPFEATLHLPLEPEEQGEPLERGTIMVTMSEAQVRALMEKHLKGLLPYIKGVNGHMGSKATADKKLMRIVLEEVKKRGLYFVDSYTTDKSVVTKVAESLGVRTASRQVFLDSGPERNDADYIRGQMRELADLARKEGKAIGIGHPRPLTLRILQQMMPELAGAGIQFVTVSKVVQ